MRNFPKKTLLLNSFFFFDSIEALNLNVSFSPFKFQFSRTQQNLASEKFNTLSTSQYNLSKERNRNGQYFEEGYEYPLSFNTSKDNLSRGGVLQSFENVVKETKFFKRNTELTQSLHANVGKQSHADNNKTSSGTDLNLNSFGYSSDENERILVPNIPAPPFVNSAIKRTSSPVYDYAYGSEWSNCDIL